MEPWLASPRAAASNGAASIIQAGAADSTVLAIHATAWIRAMRRWLTALCDGGIVAVSAVIPGKIQHLSFHLISIQRHGLDGALDQVLAIIGCFLLLSVLIWESEHQQHSRGPLLSYPPQSPKTVGAHILGLAAGTALAIAHHPLA
jgi:hypothetical protein